ncbi:LysE family translocator [Cocleimonas sp. KMM 6892]|uniref:LysE family translocator n=1 Tax=unclassified Cocleimonas TaxID=2639732 RepID=UPI002DB978F0|nr:MULTISPECIES: LysE family translocator [unclassified Cocleimonas]MEB8431919.1 LysE family translocator [Cocleimonas sp. KMM 6892]MEC4714995.1 LysE family translocator [Cocleimonas sp. KMM 6895]MEC4744191.1 LysE family translocator [Cocleimonas sp. KMM 6896]
MNIEIWITFVAASVVLLIIPGPTILTVISYSISHEYKAKIPLILALALGDSTALALSLLGLGALLTESAFWFQTVKWAGGLYLIYLGFKLFMSGVSPLTISKGKKEITSSQLFVNTYLVTALNPKGIIFFVAFLPQFLNTNTEVTTQLWILAFTFVALATLNATLYAVFAGKAQKLLSSPKTQRIFNICGGSLLTTAGLWALSVKQSQ